jgi:hypothetical protein
MAARGKFYYSETERAHLIDIAPEMVMERPEWANGYLPMLALLDSGETVEYTRMCSEHMGIDYKADFDDTGYLSTGERAGWGKPVKKIVVFKKDLPNLPNGISVEDFMDKFRAVQEAAGEYPREFILETDWSDEIE